MEQQFNTSFIPKQSLQDQAPGGGPRSYVKRRTVMGPGYFLSLLTLIVAIIAAGAVFGFTRITIATIDEQKAKLLERQSQFQTDLVDEFIREDARLKHAQALLVNHTALSELFYLLEDVTLRDVVFESLAYSNNDTAGGMQMNMVAQSAGLEPVALQIMEFEENEYLSKPLVTNMQRLESGNARFAATVYIEKQLVTLRNALSRSSARPAAPKVAAPPPASPATSSANNTGAIGDDTPLPPGSSASVGGFGN